jgi:hypothetical protein
LQLEGKQPGWQLELEGELPGWQLDRADYLTACSGVVQLAVQ